MDAVTLYRKAAKEVANRKQDYACSAITAVEGVYPSKHRTKFQDVFKPNTVGRLYPWYGYSNDENRMARSLGLLLMACIANERDEV